MRKRGYATDRPDRAGTQAAAYQGHPRHSPVRSNSPRSVNSSSAWTRLPPASATSIFNSEEMAFLLVTAGTRLMMPTKIQSQYDERVWWRQYLNIR